jgi:hypothetical protein
MSQINTLPSFAALVRLDPNDADPAASLIGSKVQAKKFRQLRLTRQPSGQS